MITLYDLLLPEGEAATLEVEVERHWFTFVDPPLADVEVEIEGLGRARTDAKGIAAFPLGVLPPGTHTRMGEPPHELPPADAEQESEPAPDQPRSSLVQ